MVVVARCDPLEPCTDKVRNFQMAETTGRHKRLSSRIRSQIPDEAHRAERTSAGNLHYLQQPILMTVAADLILSILNICLLWT